MALSTWAIVILLFPTSNPPPPDVTQNPGCRDKEVAEMMCDRTYSTFDALVRCDRALSICRIEKDQLSQKLDIRTSSVTSAVIVEERLPWWAFVIGAALLGGGVAFGLSL